MGWFVAQQEGKIKKKILNNVVNILIINIADEYLTKLNKNENNLPAIKIQIYLDKAVKLAEKRKVKVKKIDKKIYKMNEEEINEFNNIISQNESFKELVKKMNFTLALIRDRELQEKVVNEIYNKFIEFKESYESIEKQREKIFKLNWILKLSKKYVTNYNDFSN